MSRESKIIPYPIYINQPIANFSEMAVRMAHEEVTTGSAPATEKQSIDCLLVAGALWKWAYITFTPLFKIWNDATGESIPDEIKLRAFSPLPTGSPPYPLILSFSSPI